MTTDPSSPDPFAELHPRLTVAPRAGRIVAAGLAALRQADLEAASREVAAERCGERVAARARLDAAAARAVHDLDAASERLAQTRALQQGLVDGADWALSAHAALPAMTEAIARAQALFEARRVDVRDARAHLDRVLEQRSAAALAMQDADSQVEDLDGVGMDETGLRRELEAAGAAASAAHETHSRAVAEVQRIAARHDRANRTAEDLRRQLAALGAPDLECGAGADRVRNALDEWDRAALGAGADNYSQALADAFTDLLADLAQQEALTGPLPDAASLQRAELALAGAAEELRRIEGAERPCLTPEQRAALDDAHRACEEAADRVDRRIGRSAAQRRLEEAVAAERALLDRFGFESHLQVVLTGGRLTAASAERTAAEAAYLAARTSVESMRAALAGSPELDHLHSERQRLLAHITDRLGVDPDGRVIDLLRAHPMLPGAVVDELRDALAAVGVHPVGVGLAEAAQSWLEAQAVMDEAAQSARAQRIELEQALAETESRARLLTGDLAAARAAEAEAVEQLELATRSVGAVEAELTNRAGADAHRFQRYIAAQQLRTQVEALSATLTHAEHEARARFDDASSALDAAELALDRAQGALTDVTRRARLLAEDLPPAARPMGDRLQSLPELAERVAARAEALQSTVEEEEANVRDAGVRVDDAMALATAAGTGLDGPRPDDVCEALVRLLAAASEGPLVLEDPFAHAEEVTSVLEVLIDQGDRRPLVLLTDDPAVLGWAIGLPADLGAVVSAESVLNLCDESVDTISDPPTSTSSTDPSVCLPVGNH